MFFEIDEREMEQIAECVAAGETDEALTRLCDLWPNLGLPAQIKRRVAMRAAEPATQLNDLPRPAPAVAGSRASWPRIRGAH